MPRNGMEMTRAGLVSSITTCAVLIGCVVAVYEWFVIPSYRGIAREMVQDLLIKHVEITHRDTVTRHEFEMIKEQLNRIESRLYSGERK